jgi:predicted Rossmann fold nucleotide-binding protein DprA/Smf involved in DNA uptake
MRKNSIEESHQLSEPRARVTDPVTSHAAAADAKAFSRAHARVVETVLDYARGEALAVEEVARRCSLTSAQVTRAMSQLKNAGKVEESGERHRNQSGSTAAKWRFPVRPFTLEG